MKVLRKIIRWLLFLIFISTLFWITYIIYCWANCNCTNRNIRKIFASESNSKVAVFKPDTEGVPKIRLNRFLIKEPYKYPFYSAQYYSDNFFINFRFADTLTFVVDNKDTVRWGDLYVIDTVPLRIKGYNYFGELRVTYYQDTLFQSNIEHKPTVSILKQLNFGPTASDCLRECN